VDTNIGTITQIGKELDIHQSRKLSQEALPPYTTKGKLGWLACYMGYNRHQYTKRSLFTPLIKSTISNIEIKSNFISSKSICKNRILPEHQQPYPMA